MGPARRIPIAAAHPSMMSGMTLVDTLGLQPHPEGGAPVTAAPR